MTSDHSFEAASWAADILHRHGYDAYIVGGAVRDMYLGHRPKDFDIATSATPEQLAAVPDFDRSSYRDMAQAYGVTRVRFAHNGRPMELEVATFRKDIDAHKGRRHTKVEYTTLEDDVSRRDLTINALALDPATAQIIDYVGGLDDLDAGIVRFIGEPAVRIQEDPLRVMRAVRFKNQLGFSYDFVTATAIRRAVQDGVIDEVAVDRLRDELSRMLVHPSRRQALEDLDDFGILEQVLPEVVAGRGVAQPPEFHAEGDVWQHELLICEYLPPHPSRRLAWAALLHDIGKPPTFTPGVHDDRIRFNRHYAVGAEMAKTVLRRLKFSNHDIRNIYWMIYHHMAIDDLPHMRPSHQRQMMDHEAFGDLLELHRADAAASWRPGAPHVTPDFAEIEALWHAHQAEAALHRRPSLKRDVGIDGHWLLRKFGHDKRLTGLMMKRILQDLNEWYVDEGMTDEAAYERRVKRYLQEEYGNYEP